MARSLSPTLRSGSVPGNIGQKAEKVRVKSPAKGPSKNKTTVDSKNTNDQAHVNKIKERKSLFSKAKSFFGGS